MKKELTISFYSILYGILFIIAVHCWSLIITILFQKALVGWIVDFDYIPFLRLVVLFLEIIFIAKYLKKVILKYSFTQVMLFNILFVCILGISINFLFDYFSIDAVPMICGSSTNEELIEFFRLNSKNKETVKIIEPIVIVISIFIYSYFRIKEMTDE
ncbi:MAG: hypothetical protein ACPGVD_02520 [Flavobacteriales bacterium]